MKLNNANSKLLRNGWKVEQVTTFKWRATKGDNYIHFSTSSDDEVSSIYYGKEGRSAKQSVNLTAALKLLGDVPVRKYGSESQDRTPTRENICKQFVEFDTNIRPISKFPKEYLRGLKVTSKAQLEVLFREVFAKEYASRKRYNYARERQQRNLENKREELWHLIVNDFSENSGLNPLRLVRIKTKVPEFDDLDKGYGWQTPQVTAAVAGVFESSAESACRTVKLMLGEFAKVEGGEVVAIGPHNEAFAAFQQTYAVSAQATETQNMQRAQSLIKQAEDALNAARRMAEMQRKKIEVASFIDSIAMLSSVGSTDALSEANEESL